MENLVVFGGFGLLFVVLLWWGTQRAKAARAEWDRFSQETGLALSGRWPMVAFHGAWRDLHVGLVTHMHRGHKGHRHYRHEISVQIPMEIGDLNIHREGMFDKLGKVFGGQDIQTGNGAFDPAFRVQASSEAQVHSVLGPSAQQALLNVAQSHPSMHVSQGAVRISHGGTAVARNVVADLEVLSVVARAFVGR